MRKAVRTAMSAAVLVAALAFAGVSTARGQVYFEGNFPLPHGNISVGVGAPIAVGSYVPAPYLEQIEYLPDYGYGFQCDAGWVPVRHYARGWVIAERPIGINPYRYRSYRYTDSYRYRRPGSGYRYRDDRYLYRDYDRSYGDRSYGNEQYCYHED